MKRARLSRVGLNEACQGCTSMGGERVRERERERHHSSHLKNSSRTSSSNVPTKRGTT